jgi:colanic acid/amylovoran biosynthesis glycosyltransferase
MFASSGLRVAFVVKRYPRYSETFVVREILAHEQAGLDVEIFALRPPNDRHFQDLISRVRAPVNYLYLPAEGLIAEELASAMLTASCFWKTLAEAGAALPGFWASLEAAQGEEPRHVYQAVQLAREVKAKDIGHLHAPFASDATSVARLASRFAQIPYSFTARAKDIFHQNVRSEDLRRKLCDASAVITVSDYHLEYLRATYGPAAAHVQRIYNGLDLEEYSYQSPQERGPIVLAVGRFVEKKGFSDLVDACALLSNRGKLFQCRLIGTGLLKDQIKAHAQQLGLGNQIEILGPRPQSEVIKEIRNAAVLAAPCVIAQDGDRDGLPNVIQEALALGTPVVSTDVTGIPDVIRNGQTGLLVPQRNPAALADAIERLLTNPALRVRLASNGRRLIEKEFDIRQNTERRRRLFLEAARPHWQVEKERA